MKTLFLSSLLLCCTLFAPAQISLELELIANGFASPVDITNAGDERLFVVEKRGRIRIVNVDGAMNPNNFLDINPRVANGGNERGLLGLAFHPNYDENGYFFVNYTNNDGHTVVARYQVSAEDPDLADPDSEKILLTVNQPYANHNGGDLNFGPDGYLYIGLGDGGSGGDPENSGQTRQSLLGKMLRIDVNNGDPYAIPEDNPFAQTDETRDEVWALGLRNPWRFSFDRLTGDMWIGDVGQSSREEINFQPADSPGGENYGWRCYEGDIAYNTSDCAASSNYVFPAYDYESNPPVGCSVTGGFVYRGAAFPLLYGKYIYADYCTGRIWALERNEAQEWVNIDLYDGPNGSYSSFGEDYRGELYLLNIDGEVLRVRDMTTPVSEAVLQADLHIRPNPVEAAFWIEGKLPESGPYRLQLFSAQGQVVWESTRQLDTELQQKIEVNELPAGIYLFRIDRNGAGKVLKVVKE